MLAKVSRLPSLDFFSALTVDLLLKICSDKVSSAHVLYLISLTISCQNKPNGQFKLEFEAKHIRDFMQDLPIRKVPGVGRVNERLLESIGIKVCHTFSLNHTPSYLSPRPVATSTTIVHFSN